jgi:hypothetical protein
VPSYNFQLFSVWFGGNSHLSGLLLRAIIVKLGVVMNGSAALPDTTVQKPPLSANAVSAILCVWLGYFWTSLNTGKARVSTDSGGIVRKDCSRERLNSIIE